MINYGPEEVFTAADKLFDGIDYHGRANYRTISGTLRDEHDLPLIPVSIDDSKPDDIRKVIVRLRYLLSDGTRVDQSVGYTLLEGDDEPSVEQTVVFGDNWGKDIPYRPFFEKPMPALAMMQKVIDTVRERRLETSPEYRDVAWRQN